MTAATGRASAGNATAGGGMVAACDGGESGVGAETSRAGVVAAIALTGPSLSDGCLGGVGGNDAGALRATTLAFAGAVMAACSCNTGAFGAGAALAMRGAGGTR